MLFLVRAFPLEHKKFMFMFMIMLMLMILMSLVGTKLYKLSAIALKFCSDFSLCWFKSIFKVNHEKL